MRGITTPTCHNDGALDVKESAIVWAGSGELGRLRGRLRKDSMAKRPRSILMF